MSKNNSSILSIAALLLGGFFVFRSKKNSAVGQINKSEKKLFNYVDSEMIKKQFSKEIALFKITEIFVIDGELYTTSIYDLPQSLIKEIDDSIPRNYVPS